MKFRKRKTKKIYRVILFLAAAIRTLEISELKKMPPLDSCEEIYRVKNNRRNSRKHVQLRPSLTYRRVTVDPGDFGTLNRFFFFLIKFSYDRRGDKKKKTIKIFSAVTLKHSPLNFYFSPSKIKFVFHNRVYTMSQNFF